MELIGVPYRITIGRGLDQGEVEFKRRSEATSENISTDAIVEKVLSVSSKSE